MPVVIQVFSDYACPYCYLGNVIVRRAAAHTGVEIVHRAFQLPPVADQASERVAARIADGWRNSILPLAQTLGLTMRQPARTPLTRRAHEAAAWARTQGAFEPFQQALFQAVFAEHKDVNEMSVLREIAWRVGLHPQALESALHERQQADEVDEDLLIAETYGVTMVPTFIISGHQLRGVQDEAKLRRVIELARDGKLDAEAKKLPHLPITIKPSSTNGPSPANGPSSTNGGQTSHA